MGICYAKAVTDIDGFIYYTPSDLAMRKLCSAKSNYSKQMYEQKYVGDKPTILVVCTDEGDIEMKNGCVFKTGNHPVEMFVPMMHLRDAGFTNFEFVTEAGDPVVLETWAFPQKDNDVKEMHQQWKPKMERPKKISEISSLDKYSAIFIPGGYGCMINLPRSKALGKLLHMAQELELPTITLSHGPSVLLSTAQVNGKGFAYRDYEVNCFTDKSDKAALSSGYLPGRLPWKCQEKIEKQGIKVQNYSEIGAVHRDRELITGDSPNAANKLGIFAAQILLQQ